MYMYIQYLSLKLVCGNLAFVAQPTNAIMP